MIRTTERFGTLATISLFILLSAPALACSCGGNGPIEAAKNSRLAILVKVEKSAGWRKLVVKKRFRGDSPDEIEVAFPRINSDCNLILRDDVEYLWVTDVPVEDLRRPIQLNACSNLRIADENNKAFKWLTEHAPVKKSK